MKNIIVIKAALHLYSKIIMNASQFIALIVVARFMGPTPLGIIGYATGIIGIFSLVANLGFSTTHRKKIAEGKDLAECIGTYFIIRMVLMTIWVSAFIIWIYFVQYRNDNSFLRKRRGFSPASIWMLSTGEVRYAPVHILNPELCTTFNFCSVVLHAEE